MTGELPPLPPILVVEDSPTDRELLARALRFGGVRNPIVSAADGLTAIARLLTDPAPPVLVILDLSLPGAGGIEVLRRIRREPRIERVPVLILSGDDDERSIAQAGTAGADTYATKPLTMAMLLDAIGKMGLGLAVVR